MLDDDLHNQGCFFVILVATFLNRVFIFILKLCLLIYLLNLLLEI